MSAFRDPPPVELGPLDVGLEQAAAGAEARIPSGGRLVVRAGSPVSMSMYVAGAVGSAGVLAVTALGLVAAACRWSPRGAVDFALCAVGVLIGGASLAAVLRVVDRRAPIATHSGEVVGRAAHRVVVRLAQLARHARTAPHAFGPRRVAALRRALHAANSPEIARWISEDLRGRAELLLARSIAAQREPWLLEARRRREVCGLLARAAEHLGDPTPASADLAVAERGLATTRSPDGAVGREAR